MVYRKVTNISDKNICSKLNLERNIYILLVEFYVNFHEAIFTSIDYKIIFLS